MSAGAELEAELRVLDALNQGFTVITDIWCPTTYTHRFATAIVCNPVTLAAVEKWLDEEAHDPVCEARMLALVEGRVQPCSG